MRYITLFIISSGLVVISEVMVVKDISSSNDDIITLVNADSDLLKIWLSFG